VIELYRVRCPDCGIKAEKVPLLPSEAPFSQRFEEAVGQACESTSVRRVARQFGFGGEHRAGRLAVSAPLAEETEVSDGGDEPGDRRTVVVRAGAEERDAGRVFREASQCASTKVRFEPPVWTCGTVDLLRRGRGYREELPAAEGPALSRYQDRIPRSSEAA